MSRNPEIPEWVREQIQRGLTKDNLISEKNKDKPKLNSEEIRAQLGVLQLEQLISYFSKLNADPTLTKFSTSTGIVPENSAYTIAMYQKALEILSTTIRVDGLYSSSQKDKKSETQLRIEDFQRNNNIKVDGIPGIETARKILEQLQIKEKEQITANKSKGASLPLSSAALGSNSSPSPSSQAISTNTLHTPSTGANPISLPEGMIIGNPSIFERFAIGRRLAQEEKKKNQVK